MATAADREDGESGNNSADLQWSCFLADLEPTAAGAVIY